MKTEHDQKVAERLRSLGAVTIRRAEGGRVGAVILLALTALAVALNMFSEQLFPVAINQLEASRPPLAIDPATWAFSIWGAIFALLLGHAAYGVARPHDARLAEARLPLMAAVGGLGLWPLAIAAQNFVAGTGLIAISLVATAVAWGPLHQIPAEGLVDRALTRWPVGLLLGWLSVAFTLALTGVLATEAGFASPLPVVWAGALGVLVLGLLAAAFARLGDGAYVAAVAWGLAAIVSQQGQPLITGVFALAMLGVLVARSTLRSRRAP